MERAILHKEAKLVHELNAQALDRCVKVRVT